MQTFLPYPSFTKSARALDRQRLGKQRVETWQIYKSLTQEDYGWKSHPATKMWVGYEGMLLIYGLVICSEWIGRGYKDTMLDKFARELDQRRRNRRKNKIPSWLGNDRFHASHRSALLFKNPEHYGKFQWSEKPRLDYVWPVS